MLAPADNRFIISSSPHSLGLAHNLTIPSPGLDSIKTIQESKRNLARGLQGLTFDNTGLLGTGLFSGDITTWGWPEIIFGAIGVYALYASVFQARQTKYRVEGFQRKRRKAKAARLTAKAGKLREKAKALEEQTTGIF